ncbi:MAG TPA: protein translocase subunit SecD [Firmicutes bacterium]|nr:protein translocase subunit SecD [Bacillota bacterium]
MKWGNLTKFFLVIIVALVAAYFLAEPIQNSIKLGLDLKGGTHLVLELVDTPEAPVDEQAALGVMNILWQRVDGFGLTEPIIQRQGERRIIVELPGHDDPEEAIRVLSMTAHLEFWDEEGNVILTGRDLKDANFVYDQENKPTVALEFSAEGAKKFAAATEENLGRPIIIVLDESILSAPIVQEVISDGKAQITGITSAQEAQRIAVGLRSGALPVKVQVEESRSIGPTLGEDSIKKSITAFIYGIIAVLLFMVIVYRVSGLVADIALGIYVLLFACSLALFNATLTLPGIAGLILSLGMAVDANVIIYERVKEELRNGKTIKAAVDSGFQRAFRTIIDANVTTLIAAGVLYYLGTGPIQGFAVTLSIGIICSMITAIIITRLLLSFLIESKIFKSSAYFGL